MFRFVILLLLTPLVFGGAWTPEKGGLYLKLSANNFESDSSFNVTGDQVPAVGTFTDEHLALYFEWGLTDRIALFGSQTYKRIEQRNTSAGISLAIDNSGFGDTEIGVRYNFSRSQYPLSFALIAKLPYLYDDDDFLALGNHQEDLEGRLLYGRSLGKYAYMGLEAGYRYRTDDPSDEYRYLIEFGLSPTPWLYMRSKLDGIQSVDDPAASGSSFGNPTINQAFDLNKLELTVGVSLSQRWHVETTYTDHISGKNIAADRNIQLGVVFSR